MLAGSAIDAAATRRAVRIFQMNALLSMGTLFLTIEPVSTPCRQPKHPEESGPAA